MELVTYKAFSPHKGYIIKDSGKRFGYAVLRPDWKVTTRWHHELDVPARTYAWFVTLLLDRTLAKKEAKADAFKNAPHFNHRFFTEEDMQQWLKELKREKTRKRALDVSGPSSVEIPISLFKRLMQESDRTLTL